MLGFDGVITVYNTKYNPETGFDDYHHTVVKKVSWHSQNKVITAGSGLVYAEIFKVRVPEFAECGKVFVLPENYTDPATQYTFAAGDVVIKGEFAAATNGTAIAAISRDNSQAFTVLAYHDNRRIGLKHIYVEGK
ncbi:MAG: DUF6751 family protein [Oscillospiraceae bacterium]